MKATLIKRMFAYLIDLSLLIIAMTIFNLLESPANYLNKQMNLNSNYIIGSLTLNEYIEQIGPLYRNIDMSNIHIIILNIIYIILYFVIIPYYNNGQTLGKKILSLRVRSLGNKKATLNQLFMRSIIISGLFYLFFLIICLFLPFNYFVLISIVGFLQIILIIICILMALFRKDKRGLHDIISKTRVMNIK